MAVNENSDPTDVRNWVVCRMSAFWRLLAVSCLSATGPDSGIASARAAVCFYGRNDVGNRHYLSVLRAVICAPVWRFAFHPLTLFRDLAKYLFVSIVFKALSDPTRRAVLEMLRDGSKTAGELSARFSVSRPTMSAHFAVLREAGLVCSERDGKNIIYHLQMSVLEEALMSLAGSFGLNFSYSSGCPSKIKGNHT